ncbi:MAG: hypothetical protein OEL56_05330 [Nitrosopumilus sp.]|nr:hypothetical protein [Nitrosopumilus sp.]MDH3489852.1 hypothetical protein [Nitrosopumilus sp.]MDH3516674.1 hypothetical protein [Nitrosopumilus sp.]MDH3564683.1 hypothetical protein [Nitrosopumilus sp.]MDH5417165.1 hypothetical protein [Nitrosopumilus sp.]
MSKIENINNHKDIYSVWNDGVKTFYSNMEKSIPQFHQAATNLLQEYVQAWNDASSSIIDIQREFATKVGINANMQESSMNMMHDSAEKIRGSFNIHTMMSIASIDATKQNIHTWNENSKSFANINKDIMDSLVLPFNSKI